MQRLLLPPSFIFSNWSSMFPPLTLFCITQHAEERPLCLAAPPPPSREFRLIPQHTTVPISRGTKPSANLLPNSVCYPTITPRAAWTPWNPAASMKAHRCEDTLGDWPDTFWFLFHQPIQRRQQNRRIIVSARPPHEPSDRKRKIQTTSQNTRQMNIFNEREHHEVYLHVGRLMHSCTQSIEAIKGDLLCVSLSVHLTFINLGELREVEAPREEQSKEI